MSYTTGTCFAIHYASKIMVLFSKEILKSNYVVFNPDAIMTTFFMFPAKICAACC